MRSRARARGQFNPYVSGIAIPRVGATVGKVVWLWLLTMRIIATMCLQATSELGRSVMRQELASYLSFYGATVSIIRPAIIIAILTGLWVALRRTDLAPAARTRTWLAVVLPFVAWVVFIWTVATP